jgi:hypothetical protein
MKKGVKITLIVVSLGLAFYSGYLIKKAFIDKGYPNESVEKEVFLGYYVLMLGLPNTKANRDKYRSMSLEKLKQELGIED